MLYFQYLFYGSIFGRRRAVFFFSRMILRSELARSILRPSSGCSVPALEGRLCWSPRRRPTDGRYGENPNRLQHYYQSRSSSSPSPADGQGSTLKAFPKSAFRSVHHDIRFVEDDWESPTLGAWGLGWEVWLDGMEVTQFTYFQQVGGIDLRPVSLEVAYGLERIAIYLRC